MIHYPWKLKTLQAWWPVVATWTTAWSLMVYLDQSEDLANLALILVLAAAVNGMWLSALESIAMCALAVVVFNWQFVPPRGTLTVDLRQHAWLLVTMFGVGSVVAWVTSRQRELAEVAKQMAATAELQRGFEANLRNQSDQGIAETLAAALDQVGRTGSFVMFQSSSLGSERRYQSGYASRDEEAHVIQFTLTRSTLPARMEGIEGQGVYILPIRGPVNVLGAVVIRLDDSTSVYSNTIKVAESLCDQAGLHWERNEANARSRQAEQEAHAQQLRNTLLASISHDYRTPLATILGAASSLLTQAGKLTPAQAQARARTIVEEVELLRIMTTNTLELSRLDAAGVQIQRDWESLEELIGSSVSRARVRYPEIRIHVRLEPQLPLLRCDAGLLVQLLNNLIDNAVKYGPPHQTIEVVGRRVETQLLLSVADRGCGIPTAQRERIFQTFARGPAPLEEPGTQRGAGLGLALCRAVMQAHGGSIRPRPRQRGGTSMECYFPLEAQPVAPEENVA